MIAVEEVIEVFEVIGDDNERDAAAAEAEFPAAAEAAGLAHAAAAEGRGGQRRLLEVDRFCGRGKGAREEGQAIQ